MTVRTTWISFLTLYRMRHSPLEFDGRLRFEGFDTRRPIARRVSEDNIGVEFTQEVEE